MTQLCKPPPYRCSIGNNPWTPHWQMLIEARLFLSKNRMRLLRHAVVSSQNQCD